MLCTLFYYMLVSQSRPQSSDPAAQFGKATCINDSGGNFWGTVTVHFPYYKHLRTCEHLIFIHNL